MNPTFRVWMLLQRLGQIWMWSGLQQLIRVNSHFNVKLDLFLLDQMVQMVQMVQTEHWKQQREEGSFSHVSCHAHMHELSYREKSISQSTSKTTQNESYRVHLLVIDFYLDRLHMATLKGKADQVQHVRSDFTKPCLDFIHPSTYGHCGNMLSRVFQTFFSPATLSEGTPGIFSPFGICDPSGESSVYHPFGYTEHLFRGGVLQGIQIRYPNVKELGLCFSSGSYLWAYAIPKLWWNHISATCIPLPCPLGRYPKAHDQRWDHLTSDCDLSLSIYRVYLF